MATTTQLEISDLVMLSYAYNSIFLNKVGVAGLKPHPYSCCHGYTLSPQATFPCALLSAGCVVELTEQVVTGKVCHDCLCGQIVSGWGLCGIGAGLVWDEQGGAY